MYKTDALKSLLLKINPYLDIDTDCVKVTEKNLTKLFCDDLIVCEAFDNPEELHMGSAEIWDKARWDEKNAEVELNIEDIASDMEASGFSI